MKIITKMKNQFHIKNKKIKIFQQTRKKVKNLHILHKKNIRKILQLTMFMTKLEI